jgi:hypothetical protein
VAATAATAAVVAVVVADPEGQVVAVAKDEADMGAGGITVAVVAEDEKVVKVVAAAVTGAVIDWECDMVSG